MSIDLAPLYETSPIPLRTNPILTINCQPEETPLGRLRQTEEGEASSTVFTSK